VPPGRLDRAVRLDSHPAGPAPAFYPVRRRALRGADRGRGVTRGAGGATAPATTAVTVTVTIAVNHPATREVRMRELFCHGDIRVPGAALFLLIIYLTRRRRR